MEFLYSGPGIIFLKGTYYVKFLFYMVFEALNINVCAAVHVPYNGKNPPTPLF